MTIPAPRILKEQARNRLEGRRDSARRIVLIYTGVVVLLSLLSSILSLGLNSWIEDTGGLDGLGTRSFLQTLQSVLQVVPMFVTIFWSAGFVRIALLWADGEKAESPELFSGFRRATAVLSQQFFVMLLLFGAGMLSGYVANVLFILTPQADALVNMTELDTVTLMEAYLPLMLIYGAVLLVALVYLGYNLRLSTYFIMDHCRLGGFSAVQLSFRAMRGHKLEMLKLDLSFWWYYLLEAALVFVLYLDLILPALGIAVPINDSVFVFACLVLYSVLEVALQLRVKAGMETTYALAYRAIVTPREPEDNQANEII